MKNNLSLVLIIFQIMEDQYLSRKQRRKMERQAKKEKKNMFYMNKKRSQ